jgi:hypothetical protein
MNVPGATKLVTVPTRGSVQQLVRCLESYHKNIRSFGHTADLLVCSTQTFGATPALRGILAAWNAEIGAAAIVEAARRESIKQWLCKVSSVSPKTLSFGLDGIAKHANYGANRNVAALLAVGKHLFSFDDDTVGETSFVQARNNRIVAALGDDPVEYWPYLDPGPECDVERIHRTVDILGSHVCATSGKVEHEDGSRGRGEFVAISSGGVVGQSGLATQASLLMHSNDRVWTRMTGSPALLGDVLSGSSVIRQSLTWSKSRTSGFFATHFSLPARSSFAPFPPSYRGEDLVFWVIIRKLMEGAYCGHLPVCVDHLGARRSPAPANALGILLLLSLVIETIDTPSAKEFDSNLKRVGEVLEEMATRGKEGFVAAVFPIIRQWCYASIKDCEQILARRGHTPSYAVSIVQQRIARLELTSLAPQYAIPSEFVVDPDPWERAAEYFSMYGQLAQAWPALLKHMSAFPQCW